MAKLPYVHPKDWEDSFNCPYCHRYAIQEWYKLAGTRMSGTTYLYPESPFHFSRCPGCGEIVMWRGEAILFPPGTTEPPSADLPQEIIDIYNEAASILNSSARGAAALLRLGLVNK